MLVFQFILVALFFLLVFLIFIIEALKEMKHQLFSRNDNTGYEPAFGTDPVADRTAFSVEHLFAASACNGVPVPNIFPPWILFIYLFIYVFIYLHFIYS